MFIKIVVENWKKLFIAIGVLFVIFIVVSAALIHFTEKPEFCNTCHLMKPYHKAWTESAHKDVSCLKCHIEPGLKSHIKGKIDGLMQVLEYASGRYSEKPVATVRDISCLQEGCHEKESLRNKKIMFKDKVEFHHKTHWQEHPELGKNISLRCATCHMWLTFDKHVAVDENTCFICHFKTVPVEMITEQCTKCHTGISETETHREYMAEGMHCADCHDTIKTTDAPVLKQMCYFCHADQDKLNKIDDRELLHQKHIPDNNADCISCHELIAHGKE